MTLAHIITSRRAFNKNDFNRNCLFDFVFFPPPMMRRVVTSRPMEPLGDDKAQLLVADENMQDDSTMQQHSSSSLFSSPFRLFRCFTRTTETGAPRTVELPSGRCLPNVSHPRNVVRNAKYSLTSFLPIVLYQQFRFFFNLYFLVIALSQFVPALQIGSWSGERERVVTSKSS